MIEQDSKITIFQNFNVRFTFFEEEGDSGHYFRVVKEQYKGVSPVVVFRSPRNVIIMQNELRKKGYREFRSPEEVSWYATVPNDTGREELWDIIDGTFIPINSCSLKRFYLSGETYKVLDSWTKREKEERVSYHIMEQMSSETPCFLTKVITTNPKIQSLVLEYKEKPSRQQVENDYLSYDFDTEIDRICEEHDIEYW